MSRRQALFENFIYQLYETLLWEGDTGSRCDLGNVGYTMLHRLAGYPNAARLLEFLDLKQYGNTVDIVDPESGVTPLVTACWFGYLDCVRVLVQYGANVNHRCSGMNAEDLCYRDITPIYVAAEQGHLSVVEYLATHGADVNVRILPLGFTPVHRALLQKHHDIVSVLIEKFKAKVNIPCLATPGSYPVYNALTVDDLGFLETILRAPDADPNAVDANEGVAALHAASYEGDLDAVQMLIAHGADVNIQLKSGHSPLDLAVQQKKRHVADWLRHSGAQRKVLDKSWHPFTFCVLNGLQSMKTAISRGADVNSLLTPKGGTALHLCVLKRKMDACKFLVRKGADLNSKNVYGRTPLFIAADCGYVELVQFLLDKGANINAQADSGFTPLHKAACKGHGPICKLLIDRGADLELQAAELGTPLIGAVRQAHTNIVKLLLKAGADPNATNPPDSVGRVFVAQVAVQFAANKPELLRALIDAGADVTRPIITPYGSLSVLHVLPLVTDNIESLKIMVEAGAYIDSTAVCTSNDVVTFSIHVNCAARGDTCLPVRHSGTPLESVRNGGCPALVRILENTENLFKAVRENDLPSATKYLAEGGLINCGSVLYGTPLIYASWKGYDKIVKFLLAEGANINMRNVRNSSPLHYAAMYNQKQVAIELIKAGAPIDVVRWGRTPLELAQVRKGQNSDVIAVLEFTRRYLVETRMGKLRPVPNWKSDPKIVKLVLEFDGKISEADLAALFEI